MPARPTGIMVFELLMRHSHSETLTNTDQRLGVISVTLRFFQRVSLHSGNSLRS